MIEVTCPKGHTLRVQDQFAGKRGKCPQCGEPVAIPAGPTVPAVASQPRKGAPATAGKPRPVHTVPAVATRAQPPKAPLVLRSETASADSRRGALRALGAGGGVLLGVLLSVVPFFLLHLILIMIR